MKLLKAGPSPFVRKVLVTLHETDQYDAVEQVQVTASPLTPDPNLIAANPVGKIPALIRDDGPTLYDSRVICRFLDHRAQTGLYPEIRQFDTLTLEATADGIMDAAVLIVYEERFRPADKVSMEWIEGQWAKVSRALDAVSTRWMSHLHGRIDIGHIGMACALSYLDFRHDARKWRTGRDALAEWHAGFAARPSMIATEPDT
ncbi:glutathione S-transferase [Salipiger bermudensis]|uniref:Glutathione S-transferase n=1 Tax=Salipiger bermudensis (strain DSM 26914 / JCM 13377 / KCTC 12554 / HTCC2601) TaxID=314265 RepID=Q0FQA6_SALBH|nr:glutathione S-transferase [Salipiger bermudensis]EAU46341.1 Glutathione S-transferase [Salipiger bermudensis HTCC2601]